MSLFERLSRYPGLLLGVVGVVLFVSATTVIRGLHRGTAEDVLRIVMPAPLQTLLLAGDRYLAADLYIVRAMTVSAFTQDSVTFTVQGKIQEQASILNPYHGDNVLLAAAILSWHDQLDAAQFVLDRATRYRQWDVFPPFFEAFNNYYFRHDIQAAGRLLQVAAARTSGAQAVALQGMAAGWYARAADPQAGIAMIRQLLASTRDPGLQRLFQARIQRLSALAALRAAANNYRAATGRPLKALDELVRGGYLDRIPQDPLGQGYRVDDNGVPQFHRPPRKQYVLGK